MNLARTVAYGSRMAGSSTTLASRRRTLLALLAQGGTRLIPAAAKGSPEMLRIDLPQLRYPGHWQPYPAVMHSLGSVLRLRTRVNPMRNPSIVDLHKRENLFSSPFLYIAGKEALPALTSAQATDLRRFVDFGGLLVFDDASAGTHHAFRDSVTQWTSILLPESKLEPLGPSHVLFRSFYLVKQPSGRRNVEKYCLAVQQEGRIKILFLPNDLGGALARNTQGYTMPCSPGGDVQREWAHRFAVNLLLYATCTDYKSDPAHVQTLLRRRTWQ